MITMIMTRLPFDKNKWKDFITFLRKNNNPFPHYYPFEDEDNVDDDFSLFLLISHHSVACFLCLVFSLSLFPHV